MSDKMKLDMVELSDDDLDVVVGGAYVNVGMTLAEIIGTDSRLMQMLSDAGINCVGNKSMLGMSLFDAASKVGANSYALEDRMNDYLSGK